jgi:hypothetical protein
VLLLDSGRGKKLAKELHAEEASSLIQCREKGGPSESDGWGDVNANWG